MKQLTLHDYISQQQLATIRRLMKGEEKEFFFNKVTELHALISAMPKTYDQDGKGDEAVVTLHYFVGSADWYILERDVDTDGQGQIQAFGLADLYHDGGELGYISLPELFSVNAELDLYFTPTTLGELRDARRTRDARPAPDRVTA